MKRNKQNWKDEFPIEEEIEDYAGGMRQFLISCREGPLGYTLCAQEQGTEGPGYEFAAFSEISPHSALFQLRKKMDRGLATRHITRTDHGYSMMHDKLTGRIISHANGGAAIVVDGIPLSMDALAHILISHEGWSFDLTITDSLE